MVFMFIKRKSVVHKPESKNYETKHQRLLKPIAAIWVNTPTKNDELERINDKLSHQ